MRGTLFDAALMTVAILGIATILRALRPGWFSPQKARRSPAQRDTVDSGVLAGVCLVVMSVSLAASNGTKPPLEATDAAEPDTGPWLRPDSIVHFPMSTVTCLDANDLKKAMTLGLSGKATKRNAYFTEQDGEAPRCRMLPTDRAFKVIDATPENRAPESGAADRRNRPDALLAEVVDKDVVAAEHGTYVLIADRSLVQVLR